MAEVTEKPKIYFISFADSRMSAATTRIAEQAEAMNFFHEIHVMNEDGLDKEFRERWKVVMRPGVRGFGYWCWKPYIIRKKLEQLEEGDILLYCDAGCHLNPGGAERLEFYVKETCNDFVGIKAFPAFSKHTDVLERRWTKGDVFDYFTCRQRKEITDTPQIASGHIFMRKTALSLRFVQDWEKVWYDNFSLIDDTASKSSNLPTFLENRHDQSIFSILYKQYGATPLPDRETEASDYSQLKNCPFWDLRDKGYKDKRFFPRLRRWIKAKMFKAKIRMEKLRARYGK